MQLFFSHTAKGSYLIVNGIAEIISDKIKVEKLCTPIAKIWFKEDKEYSNIYLKVTSTTAYYWDTEGNKFVAVFIKKLLRRIEAANAPKHD